MSDRAALMRAVIDQPHDDALRLVLADWYEEHGEPDRAEFIRVQVEIARLGEGDRARLETLAAREKALFEARGPPEWYEGVPPWARDKVVFRRGFPSSISCTATRWLRASGLARSVPLESLALLTCHAEQLQEVAEAPHLAGLTALRPGLYPHEMVSVLLGSPHLANLRWLDLGRPGNRPGSTDGDPVATLIAQAPGLAGLEGLQLSCFELGLDGLAALAGSPYLTRLRALDLERNSFGDAGVHALASSPLATHLTALHLGNARLGTPAAVALASSPHFTRLERLCLHVNRIDAEGAETLAASPHLARLAYLNLYHNPIGDAGALALVRSPYLANLRTLELGSTGLTAEGIAALGAEKGLPRLEQLGLRHEVEVAHTPETEAAARALVGSPNLPRLREVDFHVYWVDGFVSREIHARFGPLHGEALLRRRW